LGIFTLQLNETFSGQFLSYDIILAFFLKKTKQIASLYYSATGRLIF